MAKRKSPPVVIADEVLPDPHTDVHPVRVDKRTVIYIPNDYTEEQEKDFIENWQQRVAKSSSYFD
jgi:hypothetical protein